MEPESGDLPEPGGIGEIDVQSAGADPAGRERRLEAREHALGQQQGLRAKPGGEQPLDGQPPLGHEQAALAHQRRVGDDPEVADAAIVDRVDRDAVDPHGSRDDQAERTTERRLRWPSSTSRPSGLLR